MSFQAQKSTGLLAHATKDYVRHQPEHTLLYQVVEEYYPQFIKHMSESDKILPQYVQDEFESYLKCGRLEHGLLSKKTPYRNGTTHVLFEPLDFIARLAALVPKPRVHLTRYHGVFAPNSKYRAWRFFHQEIIEK